MDRVTTWLEGRLSEHRVEPIGGEAEQYVWRIDRPREEAAPVFLEIPAAFVRSDTLTADDLIRALDGELPARVRGAATDRETAFLLTRETTGRVKELVLTETDPPPHADRSVRQPPDAPGPVPR